MKQQTLTGFERYAKTTRRAQFLADMQVIVPWADLTAVVEPFYPKISEAGGRSPLPLERMLRVYFCSCGSTCRTRRLRKPCTSPPRCATSSASLRRPRTKSHCQLRI